MRLLGHLVSIKHGGGQQSVTKHNQSIGVNQPVHWFLGGKGLGIQQGMSVWVGLPKSTTMKVDQGISLERITPIGIVQTNKKTPSEPQR